MTEERSRSIFLQKAGYQGGVEGWAHHRVANVVGEGEELQLGLQNMSAWGADSTSTVSAEVVCTAPTLPQSACR